VILLFFHQVITERKGVPDGLNTPPAMYSPTRWKDLDGNFWFYGGYGPEEFLGDMWMYNPSTNKWTWVKGNKSLNQPQFMAHKAFLHPLISRLPWLVMFVMDR
jgi:hypothetical protein